MVSLRKAKPVIFAGGEFCGAGFFVVPSWVDTKKKDLGASSRSLFVSPAKPIWWLAPLMAADYGFNVQAFSVYL